MKLVTKALLSVSLFLPLGVSAAPKNCPNLKSRVKSACDVDPKGNVCSKKRAVYHRCLERRSVEKVTSQSSDVPTICFALFEPTCGKLPNGDVALFGNSCEASAMGALPIDSIFCPQLCVTVYKPVCGIDSFGNLETFSSECHSKVSGSIVVHRGGCVTK